MNARSTSGIRCLEASPLVLVTSPVRGSLRLFAERLLPVDSFTVLTLPDLWIYVAVQFPTTLAVS